MFDVSFLKVFLCITLIKLLSCVGTITPTQDFSTILIDFSPSSVFGSASDFNCTRVFPKHGFVSGGARSLNKHNFESTSERSNIRNTIDYQIAKGLNNILRNTKGEKYLDQMLVYLPQSKEDLKEKIPRNLGEKNCDVLMNLEKSEQCHVIDGLSTVLGCLLSEVDPAVWYNSSRPFTEAQNTSQKDVFLRLADHDDCVKEEIDPKIIQDELPTFYWLLQAIAHVSDAALMKTTDDVRYFHTLSTLPGWSLVGVVNSLVKNEEFRLPLSILSRRTNAHNASLVDFLVSIRGSKTKEDWKINFSYDTVRLNDTHDKTMEAHRGYTALAKTVWSALRSAIENLALTGRLGEVTITGRSLGSGVASILGVYVSSFLESEVSKNETAMMHYAENYKFPKPHVVLFGAPLVGNKAFVKRLACATELRNIHTVYDPITFLPCYKAPLCPENITTIETGHLESSPVMNERFWGRVTVTEKNLTKDWLVPGSYLNTVAWHTCAIPCWLSQNFNGSEIDRCWATGQGTVPQLPKRSFCGSLSPIYI